MAKPRAAAPLLLAGALMALAPLPAAAEGDADKGRDYAVKHCKRCHVVGDGDRYAGIMSTPSFYLFAEKWSRYEERLRSYHARLPHPANVEEPDATAVEDLTAWVSRLERPDPSKKVVD